MRTWRWLGAVLAIGAACAALAQNYPSKPVRLIARVD
jgi:hypothetical protein